MMSISVADKNRLTVRGVQNGARYLVKREATGWWIEPVPPSKRGRRRVAAATQDLTDHLEALRSVGFSFEPEKKESVPPCRF
ncbi:MAG: hypothetical protein ABSE16_02375 [Verrucomicrobiota bacterium]|jgi:hypothetical protein